MLLYFIEIVFRDFLYIYDSFENVYQGAYKMVKANP